MLDGHCCSPFRTIVDREYLDSIDQTEHSVATGEEDKMKARIGDVIYWLFAAIAVVLVATSGSTNRSGSDIGQVLAAAIVYAIGRDMRRVLRE
jgi:hypothetical protein